MQYFSSSVNEPIRRGKNALLKKRKQVEITFLLLGGPFLRLYT